MAGYGGPKADTPSLWELANQPIIEGDLEPAEGSWSNLWGPDIARGVNQIGQNLMDGGSWTNPLTWPGFLAGASVEALSKPFKDYVDGEDVSGLDASMAAIEAIPGVKLAKMGAQRAIGASAVGAALTKKARSFEDAHPRGDWYRGGQPAHMVGMAWDTIRDAAQRLGDTEAAALFKKHGISPTKAREFKQFFNQLDNPFIKTGKTKKSTATPNEINSEAEYTAAMFEKYFPGNKAFAKDMGNHLLPKTVTTTGADMAVSGIPMAKVIDTPMSNQALAAHVSGPMVKEYGLDGKNVVLATKPWNDSPLERLTTLSNQKNGRVQGPSYKYHGINGKYNPSATALMLYKKMDGAFTMDSLQAAAKKHNSDSFDALLRKEKHALAARNGKPLTGPMMRSLRDRHFAQDPLVNVDELMNSAVISDGYISFGGRVLGQDRMFAHYNTRFVVRDGADPRNTPWKGYGDGNGRIAKEGDIHGSYDDDARLFTYDEMRQGTGVPVIDNTLNAGTDELMGIDVMSVTRGNGTLTTSPSQASGGLGGKTRAEMTRDAIERKMAYESTLRDRAIHATKVGVGMTGLGNIWGDDSP